MEVLYLSKKNKEALLEKVDYVKEYSGFYKKKFKNAGIDPVTIDDFFRIPFTDKWEIVEDQMQYPPYGANLCVDEKFISRVHKTSGTTGRAVLIALTQNDISCAIQAGAKCFISAGLTEEDTVVHCLNYCMWSGGYTDHQSLEKTGATVIPFGVGNSEELIRVILELKPTAIHCTPSYLSRLENILQEKFALVPKDLGLRIGLFGGEGGLQNINFRRHLEKKWGFIAMNANYGVSESLSMYGAECQCQQGMHFFGDDVIYAELIDPTTKRNIPIEQGAIGELVVTNLRKEAQPLIRYRTHDLVKVLSTDLCDCGEIGFRFEIMGRSDDMLVIKGLNVFPKSIEMVIKDNIDILSGEYRIYVSRDEPKEYLKIVIEQESSCLLSENEITKIIAKQFKDKITILPQIEIVPENYFPRTEGKTKHIVLE